MSLNSLLAYLIFMRYKIDNGHMNEDELIQLHILFTIIKKYVQDEFGFKENGFEVYNGLQMSPAKVNKKKAEHKEAIFALGKDITDLMYSNSSHSYRKEISKLVSEVERLTKAIN